MEAAEYDTSTILKGYESAAYAMRCAAEKGGKTAVAALAKALAVALIGKLAQRVQVWEECDAEYNDPWWGEWWDVRPDGTPVRFRALAGSVSRLREGGYGAYALPHIANWIWSYGRLWLLERIECAQWPEVLYADTDGLIVSGKGYRRLQDSGYIKDNEWGQLRVVVGPAPCTVHGPKAVTIGGRVIQAGAPRQQRQPGDAVPGYWFRKPLRADPESWLSGYWPEEFRDYGTS